MVEYSSSYVGWWCICGGGEKRLEYVSGALLEVRSEMLDVRNYLATFVQTFHFYGLTIEARGKMSILKS